MTSLEINESGDLFEIRMVFYCLDTGISIKCCRTDVEHIDKLD